MEHADKVKKPDKSQFLKTLMEQCEPLRYVDRIHNALESADRDIKGSAAHLLVSTLLQDFAGAGSLDERRQALAFESLIISLVTHQALGQDPGDYITEELGGLELAYNPIIAGFWNTVNEFDLRGHPSITDLADELVQFTDNAELMAQTFLGNVQNKARELAKEFGLDAPKAPPRQ